MILGVTGASKKNILEQSIHSWSTRTHEMTLSLRFIEFVTGYSQVICICCLALQDLLYMDTQEIVGWKIGELWNYKWSNLLIWFNSQSLSGALSIYSTSIMLLKVFLFKSRLLHWLQSISLDSFSFPSNAKVPCLKFVKPPIFLNEHAKQPSEYLKAMASKPTNSKRLMDQFNDHLTTLPNCLVVSWNSTLRFKTLLKAGEVGLILPNYAENA